MARKGPELRSGALVLRQFKRSDKAQWHEVREANDDWLTPWEGTTPEGPSPKSTFGTMLRIQQREFEAGRLFPFMLEHEGRYVGQVTLGNIIRGSLRGAYIGYWIDHRAAGRGLMPTAVAMVLDFGLTDVGLHRIEINIRPENARSIRVVEKLHLPFEGLRPRYLHIAGDWRDHNCYVADTETMPQGGYLQRWLRESGRD